MSMRSGLVTLGLALRTRLGSAAAQVLSLVESGMEALEAARLVEPSVRSFRPDREADRVRLLAEEGLTPGAIAARLGMRPKRVRRIANRYGIDLRRRRPAVEPRPAPRVAPAPTPCMPRSGLYVLLQLARECGYSKGALARFGKATGVWLDQAARLAVIARGFATTLHGLREHLILRDLQPEGVRAVLEAIEGLSWEGTRDRNHALARIDKLVAVYFNSNDDEDFFERVEQRFDRNRRNVA